mgnify:CR=1 FL=1
MRILLACISCQRDKDKNQAQRETFGKEVVGADVRFFLGRDADKNHEDEVILDVDDGYGGLSHKVSAMLQWALDNGYDYIFRFDADVFVCVERLLDAIPIGHDYSGRLRGASGSWPHPYASGFAYWLSDRGARARIDNVNYDDPAEDRATANALAAVGITCHADYRYVVSKSKTSVLSAREGPRVGNDIIAAGEYSAEELRIIHKEWLTLQSAGNPRKIPVGTPFDDVCVLVKTIWRDGLMVKCTKLIEQHLPGARIIVVDDGFEDKEKSKHYYDLRTRGHSCVWMKFDSGFGAKSNEAKKHYDRKYTLIFSDDFQADEKTAQDVLKMIRVLEARPDIGIASGRVDNQPYEAFSTETVRPDGKIDVVLTPADYSDDKWEHLGDIRYLMVDHTVNYNLIRREVFKHLIWNEEYKIGGDHYLAYSQAKAAGWRICYVDGVSIDQMKPFPGSCDPMYGNARGRARFALPSLFKRHNWASFTAIDGRVDTPESVQRWVDDQVAKHPERTEASQASFLSPHGRIDHSAIRRAKRQAKRAKREANRTKLALLPPSVLSGERKRIVLKGFKPKKKSNGHKSV